MKIDRTNYEIWFIDWLDGKLNDHQIEQLNLFLSENTDLKEELKEIDSAPVSPPSAEFRYKAGLKRDPADISDDQFDYLCAAYAENDLSPEEAQELSGIIAADLHRKNVSELFSRLKLTAPRIIYLNKQKLYKRTPLQKTLRISAAFLAAAATVAFLITFPIFNSEYSKESNAEFSQLETDNSSPEHFSVPQQKVITVPELKQSREVVTSNNPVIASVTENLKHPVNEITESFQEYRTPEIINEAQVPSCSDIIKLYPTDIGNLTLIPLSFNGQIQPEERWAAGRFLAKLFRDKILKEETTDDSPIKGYEIAEAGVTGLNKLLGWEMAFEKNNDENGELKSIYFSSKILKIQAPINKSENGD
jgi:hypothetical protein